MTKNYVKEDNSSSGLPVKFSVKIANKINVIYEYNQNNINGLSKWLDYLEWLKIYMSKRSVAWDYANQNTKFPNGTRYVNKLDIGYTVKCDAKGAYVYIFMLNLKLQEFGLKEPESLYENVNTYKKSSQKQLSNDEYCRLLLEKYEQYLYDLFR